MSWKIQDKQQTSDFYRIQIPSSAMFKYKNSSTNNGFVPRTNDWNKTTYESDHVCKPVIIDSEGRKHPIVSYAPNHTTETYVTETETVVQRVHLPVTEYRYSSSAEVLPLNTTGYDEDKWRKPVSPLRERPHYTHSPVSEYRLSSPKKGTHSPYSEYRQSSPTKGTHSPYNEYRYSSPTRGTQSPYSEYRHSSPTKGTRSPYSEYRHSSPTKGSYDPFNEYKQSSPTKGTRDPFSEYKNSAPTKVVPVKDHGYGEDKWHSKPLSPVHERPKEVEEFLTKVQTEVSRPPNKFGPLNANLWHQSPNSNKGYLGSKGYGDYNDLSNKESFVPKNEYYDDYYRRNDSPREPAMNTSGGWSRPTRSTLASPPNSTLSKPTNDIGTAIEMLKEAARPAPVTTTAPSRFTVPVSTGPRRDGDTETIDSKEATRRYANFKLPSRPVDTYSNAPVIDSREALRKYNGTTV